MSRQPEHSQEWSLYCSYDFRLPLKTELTPQEDELYDSDALSTDVLNDDMSSSRESSSTSDSLYAIPPPRIMRTIARNRQNSEHFSIRDVPPLSLDGTSDSAAHHRTSATNKAPSASSRQPFPTLLTLSMRAQPRPLSPYQVPCQGVLSGS